MEFKTFKMFEEESLILDTKQKVKKWLDSMNIRNYTINDDLSVDVDGNVDLSGQNFERIPVKFGKVKGDFDCSDCDNLVSLEGSPLEVKGDFGCDNCKNLVSLEEAPQDVDGSFYCYGCQNLTSLKGCPEIIKKNFWCHNCPSLVSLEGFPKELNMITCKRTPFENLFNNANVHDFAKMSEQEKENFIIEAYKENRIDERVFKANISKQKQIAYKGLITGKKFGI